MDVAYLALLLSLGTGTSSTEKSFRLYINPNNDCIKITRNVTSATGNQDFQRMRLSVEDDKSIMASFGDSIIKLSSGGGIQALFQLNYSYNPEWKIRKIIDFVELNDSFVITATGGEGVFSCPRKQLISSRSILLNCSVKVGKYGSPRGGSFAEAAFFSAGVMDVFSPASVFVADDKVIHLVNFQTERVTTFSLLTESYYISDMKVVRNHLYICSNKYIKLLVYDENSGRLSESQTFFSSQTNKMTDMVIITSTIFAVISFGKLVFWDLKLNLTYIPRLINSVDCHLSNCPLTSLKTMLVMGEQVIVGYNLGCGLSSITVGGDCKKPIADFSYTPSTPIYIAGDEVCITSSNTSLHNSIENCDLISKCLQNGSWHQVMLGESIISNQNPENTLFQDTTVSPAVKANQIFSPVSISLTVIVCLSLLAILSGLTFYLKHHKRTEASRTRISENHSVIDDNVYEEIDYSHQSAETQNSSSHENVRTGHEETTVMRINSHDDSDILGLYVTDAY